MKRKILKADCETREKRKREKKEEPEFDRFLGRKNTHEWEMSVYSQGCLGTLLVTLGILTYIRFLLLIVF